MAKGTSKKTSTDLTTQISKAQFVELAAKADNDDQDSMLALFAAAKQVNVKELTKVAGDDYQELEEGETYVFICMGIAADALPSKDPMKAAQGVRVDGVTLRKEDGSMTINADTVLVSTVKRTPPEKFPCMMMIHVKGEKKSAMGAYKDLEIYLY